MHNMHGAKRPLARLISMMTDSSVYRLKEIFLSSPARLDPFETLHVTIAKAYDDHSAQKLDLTSQSVAYSKDYEFRFTGVQNFFDSELGVSKLIGLISCPELEAIRDELGHDHQYGLGIQFIHASPPLSRSNKAFFASVGDTLVFKETVPFTLKSLWYLHEDQYVEVFKSHYIGFGNSARETF